MSADQLSPVSGLLAIGFGVLSFMSPCCLPLLPAYLGMIAGSASVASEESDTWLLWWNGVSFVTGLSIVFALLGAGASALGGLLAESRPLVVQIGAVLTVIFGLQMLGVLRLESLARTYLRVHLPPLAGRRGALGAFVIGAAFGIGWTPCIGMFLGSLLALAAQEETVAQGSALLLLYGIGLGGPFVLAGLAADRGLRWARCMRRHLGTIERVGGLVLVVMGVLLFTGQLTAINAWAIRTFGQGLVL
jgi:cytochrome c-type biogenesis protein